MCVNLKLKINKVFYTETTQCKLIFLTFQEEYPHKRRTARTLSTAAVLLQNSKPNKLRNTEKYKKKSFSETLIRTTNFQVRLCSTGYVDEVKWFAREIQKNTNFCLPFQFLFYIFIFHFFQDCLVLFFKFYTHKSVEDEFLAVRHFFASTSSHAAGWQDTWGGGGGGTYTCLL